MSPEPPRSVVDLESVSLRALVDVLLALPRPERIKVHLAYAVAVATDEALAQYEDWLRAE